MGEGMVHSESRWRAFLAPEFWLLVVAALAAMYHVPWWVTVPLVMAGLAIKDLPKYIGLWPRAQAAGAVLEWWFLVAVSTALSLAVAVGVHVLGNVVRWMKWW